MYYGQWTLDCGINDHITIIYTPTFTPATQHTNTEYECTLYGCTFIRMYLAVVKRHSHASCMLHEMT